VSGATGPRSEPVSGATGRRGEAGVVVAVTGRRSAALVSSTDATERRQRGERKVHQGPTGAASSTGPGRSLRTTPIAAK